VAFDVFLGQVNKGDLRFLSQINQGLFVAGGGSLIKGATLATGLVTSVNGPAVSSARRCASKILSRFFLPAR